MEVTEIVRSALLALPHEHNVSFCGFACTVRRGRHVDLRLSVGGPFYVNPTFTLAFGDGRVYFCEVKSEYLIARSEAYEPVYMAPNELLDISEDDTSVTVIEHVVGTLLSNPYRRLSLRAHSNSCHAQQRSPRT